jgi:hypothetical protein
MLQLGDWYLDISGIWASSTLRRELGPERKAFCQLLPSCRSGNYHNITNGRRRRLDEVDLLIHSELSPIDVIPTVPCRQESQTLAFLNSQFPSVPFIPSGAAADVAEERERRTAKLHLNDARRDDVFIDLNSDGHIVLRVVTGVLVVEIGVERGVGGRSFVSEDRSGLVSGSSSSSGVFNIDGGCDVLGTRLLGFSGILLSALGLGGGFGAGLLGGSGSAVLGLVVLSGAVLDFLRLGSAWFARFLGRCGGLFSISGGSSSFVVVLVIRLIAILRVDLGLGGAGLARLLAWGLGIFSAVFSSAIGFVGLALGRARLARSGGGLGLGSCLLSAGWSGGAGNVAGSFFGVDLLLCEAETLLAGTDRLGAKVRDNFVPVDL